MNVVPNNESAGSALPPMKPSRMPNYILGILAAQLRVQNTSQPRRDTAVSAHAPMGEPEHDRVEGENEEQNHNLDGWTSSSSSSEPDGEEIRFLRQYLAEQEADPAVSAPGTEAAPDSTEGPAELATVPEICTPVSARLSVRCPASLRLGHRLIARYC